MKDVSEWGVPEWRSLLQGKEFTDEDDGVRRVITDVVFSHEDDVYDVIMTVRRILIIAVVYHLPHSLNVTSCNSMVDKAFLGLKRKHFSTVILTFKSVFPNSMAASMIISCLSWAVP